MAKLSCMKFSRKFAIHKFGIIVRSPSLHSAHSCWMWREFNGGNYFVGLRTNQSKALSNEVMLFLRCTPQLHDNMKHKLILSVLRIIIIFDSNILKYFAKIAVNGTRAYM